MNPFQEFLFIPGLQLAVISAQAGHLSDSPGRESMFPEHNKECSQKEN